MCSTEDDQIIGNLCPSCFKLEPIFDFCLECDIDCVKCTCRKEFSSYVDFKDHHHREKHSTFIRGEIKLKETGTRRVFVCSLCKSLFKDHKNVSIHLRSVHCTSKKYTCSHCRRKFFTKVSLRRHIQTHSEQPSYTCDICQKSYFRFAHLKYHIVSHLNEKSFECNFCDKSFNDKYLLSRHLKQHSAEKLFKCDQCDKLFIFHFTLRRHKLTHTPKNNFSCDVCKKSYKWKVDLKRHVLKHIQGNSFECSICKKSFARKSYLLQHKLTHGTAKLHMCFCGKAFKFLSGLSKHRKTHK